MRVATPGFNHGVALSCAVANLALLPHYQPDLIMEPCNLDGWVAFMDDAGFLPPTVMYALSPVVYKYLIQSISNHIIVIIRLNINASAMLVADADISGPLTAAHVVLVPPSLPLYNVLSFCFLLPFPSQTSNIVPAKATFSLRNMSSCHVVMVC